jgi:predicted ATPase
LAVFAGGATFEGAERVIDAGLDTLGSLVEESLVRRTDDRFWMYETIREFAIEQLDASGEADEIRRRHAEYFLAVAEEPSRTFAKRTTSGSTLSRPSRATFGPLSNISS